MNASCYALLRAAGTQHRCQAQAAITLQRAATYHGHTTGSTIALHGMLTLLLAAHVVRMDGMLLQSGMCFFGP